MAHAPATKPASSAPAHAPRGNAKTTVSRDTRPRSPGGRTAHSHQIAVPVPTTPATPTPPANPPKRTKAPAAPKPEPGKRRTSKPAAPKRMSALDAAALVLAKSDKPMTAKGLIEAVTARGLWSSPAGKTPHSTLYSAIIREIAAKGKQARFKKHDRGLFTAVRGR
jgi:hypothetical protein